GLAAPMLAIRLSELASTGEAEISLFQGLCSEKTCLPCKLAPTPRSGTAGAFPLAGGSALNVYAVIATATSNVQNIVSLSIAPPEPGIVPVPTHIGQKEFENAIA